MKKFMKECLKKYRKNQSSNVLKKIKENDELRSVEVDVVNQIYQG